MHWHLAIGHNPTHADWALTYESPGELIKDFVGLTRILVAPEHSDEYFANATQQLASSIATESDFAWGVHNSFVRIVVSACDLNCYRWSDN